MKILTSILLFPLCLLAQVGINTTTPIASLDVEGNVRIAVMDEGTDVAARDSILVMDGNQIVRYVSSSQIFSNVEKSLVKGRVTTAGGISISSGDSIIPFNTTEFDLKNEFNNTTNEFVASSAGIYKITVQIKQSLLSVGDFGLSIYKVDTSGIETLLARERYLNVSVSVLGIGVNVSSPVRKTLTVTSLDPGELIRFKTNSAVSLTLSAASSDTFFTIEQIR